MSTARVHTTSQRTAAPVGRANRIHNRLASLNDTHVVSGDPFSRDYRRERPRVVALFPSVESRFRRDTECARERLKVDRLSVGDRNGRPHKAHMSNAARSGASPDPAPPQRDHTFDA
eukprot:876334-Prorocentrum_minimum.AAC.8